MHSSCHHSSSIEVYSVSCDSDALLIREENNYAQLTSFGGTFPLNLIVDVQIKKDRPRTQLKTQLSPVTQ